MIESFRNIFAIPDLRKRVLFTFGLLGVYRIGCHIPSPGVDPNALLDFMQSQQNGLLGFVNTSPAAACRRSRCSRWASCPTSPHRSSCSS